MPLSEKPDAPQFKLGEGEFVFMMAMTMALQALAIDSMLPALGAISHDLGVADPNKRQLIVGAFLIAAGVSSLIPGSLADRYGRRPVLFGALMCYAVFAIGCAAAQSFGQLLTMRVLQAVGSSALIVMPAAIIRDRFGGDRMARALSTVSVIFMIVPMLAPSFGQAVMLFASWRWIFGGMALMAMVMMAWAWRRLPETLHPDYRQPIVPRAIVRNMALSARNRASIGYVVGSSMVMAGLYGYINSAQQLVAEHFGAGKWFPLLFAVSAGSMAIASFTNSRIVERFGARRVSHAAVLAFIAISSLQVWQAASGDETLAQFMPLMTLNMMMVGFIGANFGSIAMQPFAEIAGAASSFQSFTRMVVGAVLGALIGQAFDGTALPLALALLAGGIISLLLVLYSEHGKLFRRLNPRGTPRDPGLPAPR
jgi:DHA1 family bicyclomycin/chloramphenicol resistance-like MFS transporter